MATPDNARGSPALVSLRFLALEDLVNPGNDAARPVFQLGANLIVVGRPGEGLEHLGRGRFGLHDSHQDGIIERTHDFYDLRGGRRSSNLLHRTVLPITRGPLRSAV